MVNEDNPGSQATAQHYLSKRPGSKVVMVRLGNDYQLQSYSTAASARETILKAASDNGCTAVALCFEKPAYVGQGGGTSASDKIASINFAMTHPFDQNSNMLAPWSSPLTAGYAPSIAFIDQCFDAHGKGTMGKVFLLATNDGNDAGTNTDYRGTARAAQFNALSKGNPPLPLTVVYRDNRAGGPWNLNWFTDQREMSTYFTGMAQAWVGLDTNTYTKGWIGDNVTSHGGRLGQHYGQAPMTDFTDRGCVLTTGTVSEPWQGEPWGNIAEQFLDTTKALPLWFSGKSSAEVYRAGIKYPTRNLGMFCPFTAPFYAGVVPPPVDPPPVDPPPVDPPPVDPPPTTIRGRWRFNAGTDNPIRASVGPNMIRRAGGATVSGGLLDNRNGNSRWTLSLNGVTRVKLNKLKPASMGYQLLFTSPTNGRGLILLPDGSLLDNTDPNNEPVLLPAGTLSVDTEWSGTIVLPKPMDIRGFGAGTDQGNCFTGSIDEIEVS